MKKLLIANRGEIARRVIRTAHAMGIDTVAVYSDADRDALHVREATTAYALGGLSAADSYLRVDRLLAAARATGADALHPGYGFLSEDAAFAQAVVDAGLVWVGPPPAAIRALGSKSGAKALALAHGVPCLPGYAGADQSPEVFEAEAVRLGFPLMVKAVAGGGGRGMRLVTDMAQLRPALHSARSEALAGFGNGDLLIERALLRPRHVEVQVFADAHGHCIHLGERDCSVQRWHQKIIEEAPSPAVSPALRADLGRCAVALALAAGYVGAGTVEFLLDEDAGVHTFFLMEMNTRLQVEHPVTEMLTGLDLVEWQLRIARGEPLPLTQEQVRWQGHAIEVRLCAEDDNHTPHTGLVRHFSAPAASPGLRFDHALETGCTVTPLYDAMMGKLIAHAPTRAEAIDRLGHALAHTQVLGLPTNRAFLASCLQHPVFRAGGALIPFLAEHGAAVRAALQPTPEALVVAALAALYSNAAPAAALPSPYARSMRWRVGANTLALSVQETGGGAVRVGMEQQTHVAQVHTLGAGMLRITLNGVGWQAHAVVLGPTGGVPRWHVQVSGGSLPAGQASQDLWLDDLSLAPRAAAGGAAAGRDLRAPFNGKLLALHAQVGDTVARGAPLLVIESMKLEHTLAAPRDGTVDSLHVAVGQQVAPGQLLVTFVA
ncbi:MAG: biotin carboxylase N-terminal domain-containing protein [Hydrogenophaga sp.]|uniref:ATP-binding protein n=1 Tax=Hydrogenophaga sp. TaxID=1904254 RepID=UPI00274BCF97|nr:biotin carboxylase N-terminal domain-containing protein [Hydrogenophaga sp.]MDP2416681.1 biotin carboxylase N-terminal domain-containing protein [Hydrogenophaga sp.]MDZ4187989.1 biotin carboxylase N-terminal domain-containing protein [Hydrogenophaga sp.]